jgi:PAS domain S-box-containing protein
LAARWRRQQQFLNELRASPDGVVVVDHNGFVLYGNRSAAKMFGRDAEQLRGEAIGYPLAGPTWPS